MTKLFTMSAAKKKKDAEKTEKSWGAKVVKHTLDKGDNEKDTGERLDKLIFKNKTEEKCGEVKRKRDVRVTSCILWSAGVLSMDPPMRTQETQMLKKIDSPLDTLEIPIFSLCLLQTKTKLIIQIDH